MNNDILKEKIKEAVKKELDELKKQGWIDDTDKIFELFESASNNKTKSIIDCIKDCTSPVKIDENDEPETILKKIKTIFRAFSLFKPKETKVLIMGQDPYPSIKYPNMADGLAFSQNREGKYAVESLLNIFKAIKAYQYKENDKLIKYFCDIEQEEVPWNTNLKKWAKNNGILLLNTALTHENDDKDTVKLHRNTWEKFIQQVIKKLINRKLCKKEKLAVFLWGKDAQETFLKSFCCSDEKLNSCLNFNELQYPGIIRKNDKFEFRESSFKLINKKNEIAIDNIDNIKIYMTSHPCNMSVIKGFCCNAPKHFKECDDFLGANDDGYFIWQDIDKYLEK